MSVSKLRKLFDRHILAKNLRELYFESRRRYWTVFQPEMPDPVFIIGCSRAGTTVTFETIRSSPYFRSFPYEIPQFWYRLRAPQDNAWESDVATAQHASEEHRRRALAYFYSRLGRGRVLDKTCINILRLDYLYALFPKAHFIYIQRDGRDNISSLIDGWKQHGHFALARLIGQLPARVEIDQGRFDDWCFFLPPGWREYSRASLEEVCAHQWITANRMALDAKQRIPEGQWIQLRYEDIFSRPVEMFQTVFERLGLPFDEPLRARCASLSKRPTSLVKGLPEQQKWRKHNRQAIETVLKKIRPMLIELGYGVD
jgi:hypothetical protein